MNKTKLIKKLEDKPSYLRWGDDRLASYFKTSVRAVRAAKTLLKENCSTNSNVNTLIISDLHLPFEHEKALSFCKRIKEKWDCEKVIFTGDIIDNHASSFHGIGTRSKSADEELQLVKDLIQPWYREFPEAYVCNGNHDAIVTRKAEFTNVSKEWIRPIPEVLGIPNWKFRDSWSFDDYVVIHGTDGKSIKNKLFKYGGNKSIIQGHFHSCTSLEYYNNKLWGMQLGCLIDKEAYAFEYAKNTSAGIILSIGVIVNGVPIIETLKY